MSREEIDRASAMRLIEARRISKRAAAEQLGITERQLYRLYDRWLVEGDAGLISKKRGRPSNRAFEVSLRTRALDLVRENYSDFGPTLAHEKLVEVHDLRISLETVRKWMIDAGIWQTKSQRVISDN